MENFPHRDRFNFTNADDPYFLLDMLELINARLIEENDSALIAVYAVNQKGRSSAFVIRDLELGATVKLDRGNEAFSLALALVRLQLSPRSISLQQT